MISPVVEAIAAEDSSIVVIKVDVVRHDRMRADCYPHPSNSCGLTAECLRAIAPQDENSETAEACGIQAMPTFQFYKNSSKVEQFSGANGDKLKDIISKLK